MSLRLRVLSANDDRSLLSRFAETGDQTAFAALVERHGPLVLGVCRRVLRDAHLADDAFQAVFLVLAKRARSVRVGPSLACWLFGVARRVSLAARRRQTRMRNAEHRARNTLPQAETRAASTTDWDELLRVLDDELARLPEKLRAPVIECFFREKTQDEAAKSLGWSLSTLRRRLDRAKELLRARLTRRGATLAGVLAAGAFAASTALASVPPTLMQATLATARGGATVPIAAFAKAGISTSFAVKLGVGAVLAGLIVSGIGLMMDREPPPALPVPQSQPAEPVKPPERPTSSAPVSEWATLRGRVIWPKNQPLPVPRPIEPTTDKLHCELQGRLLDTSVIVDPQTRGLKNVVIWLRPDTDNRRDSLPKERIHPALLTARPMIHVIDQPCCQFVPRVLAARGGDTLTIRNTSPVYHNINCTADDLYLTFNITLSPGTEFSPPSPLRAQRSPIALKCDIHPWMRGFVRVFDHPYFAVTDADGRFEMPLVPVGKWRLVYWHENGYHKGRAGAWGVPVEVQGESVEMPMVEYEFPK